MWSAGVAGFEDLCRSDFHGCPAVPTVVLAATVPVAVVVVLVVVCRSGLGPGGIDALCLLHGLVQAVRVGHLDLLSDVWLQVVDEAV